MRKKRKKNAFQGHSTDIYDFEKKKTFFKETIDYNMIGYVIM